MLRRAWAWVQRVLLGRSDIYFGGSLYMRRWRIGPDWLPGIRVHHILRSDVDRELHDHPFDYVSIILRGGYREITPPRTDFERDMGYPVQHVYRAPAVLFRRAESAHRLILDRPAWTLVLRGPHRREWGFHVPGRGWVHWREFVGSRRGPEGGADVRPGPRGPFVSRGSL